MGSVNIPKRMFVIFLGVTKHYSKCMFAFIALLCRGEHQLNAVLLIDLGGTGVVIKWQNIRLLGNLLNLVNHAAACDMVGQAAKGLRTNDIGVAAVHQLQHLRRKQPALTHVIAIADNALDHGLSFFISRRSAKWCRVERTVQNAFQMLKIPHSTLVSTVFKKAAAVQLIVRQLRIHAVHHKVKHAGQHVFTVLLLQEFFQIIIA